MRDAVLTLFSERGLLLDPQACEHLLQHEDPLTLARKVIHSIAPSSTVVVTTDDVQAYIREGAVLDASRSGHGTEPGRSCAVHVLKDPSTESSSLGEAADFLAYMRSRVEKLSGHLPRARMSISQVTERSDEVSVTGIVFSVRTVKGDARIVELEDRSGTIPVYVNRDIVRITGEPLKDEVIHVCGRTSKNRSDLCIFADRIIRPEVSTTPFRPRSFDGSEGCVAFISDLHVGSRTFLPDAWNRFLKWINGSDPLARRVSIIISCGDNVDGIGIYPGQREDLLIPDIREQYSHLAELLGEVRPDVRIVILPGNHDATRPGEPQLLLPEGIRALFRDERFIFCGNPVLISANGVKVLAYHGRGIDDLIRSIHGLSYSTPIEAMVEMLKRRHLAPVYGSTVPIFPAREDNLVIEDVPDIFVTGHVHFARVAEYCGITLINASTWQAQTEYQKMRNFSPLPARVFVFDPLERRTHMLNFLN